MTGECLVISVILGALCVALFHAKRKNWGLAVLPLGFVALVTGVGMFAAEHIFKINFTFITPMVLIISSLVVSSIWIGFCSAILIKTKKMRAMYLISSVGFVFTFSLIMLIRYYNMLNVTL